MNCDADLRKENETTEIRATSGQRDCNSGDFNGSDLDPRTLDIPTVPYNVREHPKRSDLPGGGVYEVKYVSV